jgi:hypothetical protein
VPGLWAHQNSSAALFHFLGVFIFSHEAVLLSTELVQVVAIDIKVVSAIVNDKQGQLFVPDSVNSHRSQRW